MSVRYCWRCRADGPMLDDDEAEMFHHLQPGADIGEPERKRAYLDARQRLFASLVGTPDGAPQRCSLERHIASAHGPDCAACHKPLRTPDATHCAACGAGR